ncbi:hypothetical protein F5B17DRAFT_414322 [Nemania serpens]|nr:hypothetical protein F5B17DRAFT_414322 [Nemania serpens]
MFNKLLIFLPLLLLTIHLAKAQAGTTPVGPLLACDLTTFACPGVNGCCPIAGCCGSGCCALGYACINEGTSDETCCPTSDPTKCGTVASPSSSGSGSGSGSHTCTSISNCRDFSTGDVWTCLLGQTCGFSYSDCNPCPYIGGGSSSSPTSSSSSNNPTISAGEPSSSSTPDASGSSTPSSSSNPDASDGSVPSSSSSPGASGSAIPSAGDFSREVSPVLHWLVAVGLCFAYLL